MKQTLTMLTGLGLCAVAILAGYAASVANVYGPDFLTLTMVAGVLGVTGVLKGVLGE